MTNRRNAFLAKHIRQPTPDEAREIEHQEREDARQRDAQCHERELRRAYLATPGADEAGWEREKAAILAADRKERTVKGRDAARRAQGQLYRVF
jgi:hypothetical protein